MEQAAAAAGEPADAPQVEQRRSSNAEKNKMRREKKKAERQKSQLPAGIESANYTLEEEIQVCNLHGFV